MGSNPFSIFFSKEGNGRAKSFLWKNNGKWREAAPLVFDRAELTGNERRTVPIYRQATK